MTRSEDIRALAREGLSTGDIARRLGIRPQYAYNVLSRSGARVAASKDVKGDSPVKAAKSGSRLMAVNSEAPPDLSDALVLVACVKSKLSKLAPARQLYTSPLFIKVRTLIENQNAKWVILSALHGVVEPEACIAPYQKTLVNASVAERKDWAVEVHKQLAPHLEGRSRVVIFAGQRYREFLEPRLRERYEVVIPMEHLGIGKQLAWLTART